MRQLAASGLLAPVVSRLEADLAQAADDDDAATQAAAPGAPPATSDRGPFLSLAVLGDKAYSSELFRVYKAEKAALKAAKKEHR
jgi:hypothetical protein